MSLRDRLDGRKPRRAVVRLHRGDLEQLRTAVVVAADRLTAAREAGEPLDLPEEALADARAALEDSQDTIELQALPPDGYEDLQAAHTTPDGEIDVPAMRPHLLAACCVDETVQDPEWWAAQETGRRFTAGDLQTLWVAAFRLNANFGSVGAPKG